MSNKPSIPSWQRAQGPAPTPTEADTQPASEQQPEGAPAPAAPAPGTEEPTEDAAQKTAPAEAPVLDASPLVDQASKFLDDPTIRDAPHEKKVDFLRSKGVKAEDIEKLLSQESPQHVSQDFSQAGEQAWASRAPAEPAQAPAPQSQPRDIPPIVTYPEFLAQPNEKPPLVTTRRLLNTAYIAGGLVATVYGLSKYIIGPMTQNLTESRHDFASHTQEQLEKLNERLRDSASVDPATKTKPNVSDVVDDISEADSDPTELYHRDFGTQTSPTLSRRDSKSSDATEREGVVKAHENRLKILTSHLRELSSTRTNDNASSDSLKTQLSNLQTYLSDMSYQSQYYSGSGGLYGSTCGLPKTGDGKDDQINVLKNDIRAVKGVFLSARNFPAGGRNATPLGRAGG
ncbi:uncharacterized protein N0V89_004191 [Didymosphaeria variabile]|uniref:Peroxisomal membrane protein PEX14 n=1 Tax=Didymosphaeria variabile TaxID=1932322 RepID=A0A9W8XQQ0_9PLEO|nr:uncharacterized protein N0V89_004191 [Didymosphaeria variabile]KAJ4356161.1 hypothetical protein N0V89_004191 [Didymosphaeria variabile]